MKGFLRKKRILLIAVFVSITISSLLIGWWYGLFSDIGKTVKEPYDLNSIEYINRNQILSVEEYNKDEYADFKKQIPKMSTNALIETLIQYCQSILINNIYQFPESSFYYYSNPDQYPESGHLIQELLTRNNAGYQLLKAYQQCPVMYKSQLGNIIENAQALGMLELLLSRPEFQKHLFPTDFQKISQIVRQKQKEKFDEPHYSESFYNFLYTDAYNSEGKDYYGGEIDSGYMYESGWDWEKLEEYAKEYQ